MLSQGRRFKPSEAVRVLPEAKRAKGDKKVEGAKDWRREIVEIENFRK